MKNILFMCLIFFGFQQFCSAETIKVETATALSKFMKPAIEAKDAPATCWYLGQVRGYALALRNSGNKKASKLVDIATNEVGKCGGINSLNLGETFTPEEWNRLSNLQKKIEALDL